MYWVNILFGLVQFILISVILIKEIIRKSPVIFLWATLFVMFAFPHLVTCITEDMGYSTSVYLQASIFVTLFCGFYMLMRSKKQTEYITLLDAKKYEIERTGIEGTLFEYLCFAMFLVAIVGYIAYIIRSQGGLLNSSWAGARGIQNSNSYVSLAGLETRVIFMFSGLSLFFFLTKRRIKSILVLLLFLGLVVVTRNRVQVLPVLIFFISLYLIRIERIRVKHIVIGLALAMTSIYIIYAIRAFRYLGALSNVQKRFSWDYINSTVRRFLIDKNGELGLRQYFYYFIEQDNDFEGFNKGYTYIRIFLVYVPTRWTFGIKPEGFDLFMGKAVGMVAGGTMHPTLFGDCFGNLNWFGVLLGSFWALLSNGVDTLISRQTENFFKILLFFLAAYSFVVIGRGSVYNGFEVFAWGGLFLLGLKKIAPALSHTRITF